MGNQRAACMLWRQKLNKEEFKHDVSRTEHVASELCFHK